MLKARRIEGPCAPLFYSAAALLLLCGKITTAQTVDLSRLEHCADLATKDLMLACFEAIITSSKTPDTLEPEAIDLPESEPPVAEIEAVPEVPLPTEAMPQDALADDVNPGSTPAAVSTSTVEVMPQEAPAVDSNPDSESVAVTTSTAAVAATAEPAVATVITTTESSASSQLGEEHLDRPATADANDEGEVFYATVTEVAQGRNKILYFRFDNGQVWRQNEARTLTYPKSGDFDITITRGMMGDYRMRIGDNGRMVRIRRVQ
jgi:hypothetical protein